MRQKPKRPDARQTDSGSNQIAFLKTALRKWSGLAMVLGIALAMVSVVLVLKRWEPVYEARQFVRVIQDAEYLQVLPDIHKEKVDPKSQLAPIRSELLLREVLLDPEVSQTTSASSYESQIRELQSKIRYAPAGGELYSISCRDKNPKNAAIVAEKVTELFIDKFFVNYRAERIKKLTERLEDEIVATQEKIESLDRLLDGLREETDFVVGELGSLPSDVDGDLLVGLQMDLKDAQLERQELEVEKKMLEARSEDEDIDIDPAELELLVENNPEVIRVRDYLFKLENEVVLDKNQIRPVREKREFAIKRQQALLQQTIERIERKIRFDMIRKAQANAKSQLAAVDMKLMRNKLRIESNEKDIKTISENRTSVRERQARYNQLKEDKEKSEKLLSKWTDAREKIRSREISPIRVAIAGDKTVKPPTEPVEEYPIKMLGMAVFGSFLAPFVLLTLLEYRIARISDPNQIEEQVSLALIGEVADLPRRIQRNSRSRQMMRQVRLYEESVDSVTAALRFGDQSSARVVAICSASANEGKTTLASQYAISNARTSLQRTLLIDCDLRSPSVHRVFDVPLENGLAEVIDQEVTWREAVTESGIENLDVLVAGRLKGYPNRYFGTDDWLALLVEALGTYSRIVVDTPPILAASEAVAIAKACDVAVLSVIRDVSRQDAVRQAFGKLLAANVDVAGYVFGGVPQRTYAQRYGEYGYNLTK